MSIRNLAYSAALILCFAIPSAHAGTIIGGSSMLDAADLAQLETWLGQGPIDLTNIFTKNQTDLRTDNDDAVDWHAAVDNMGPTFTVFEVTTSDGNGGFDDFVFGGYNDKSWDASLEGYRYDFDDADRKNFIFNLTTAVKLDQCLSTDPECGDNFRDMGHIASLDHLRNGATFSGPTPDLYVTPSLHSGYNYQSSYGVNDPGASDGNHRFISTLDNDDSSHLWQSVGAYETFTISSAQAVPAPATMMLFGLGVFGIGFRRRL
ncbi:MAG: PEP_CTERM-anchored TLD domain-containing protein [Pseudomonadales bacterium]|nr:PEP_CTERM-anchored TLD domain-containing protein [Pseudomonadales bacterium]